MSGDLDIDVLIRVPGWKSAVGDAEAVARMAAAAAWRSAGAGADRNAVPTPPTSTLPPKGGGSGGADGKALPLDGGGLGGGGPLGATKEKDHGRTGDRRAVEAAAELAIVLADDAFVRQLNRDYRGKDRPTNVLSFSADAPSAPAPRMLGDVVLALETVLAEAAAQGKLPADHLAHLVLHGVLHLLGHDHERSGEAAVMEALEIELLAGLGIADPYADRPCTDHRAAGSEA